MPTQKNSIKKLAGVQKIKFEEILSDTLNYWRERIEKEHDTELNKGLSKIIIKVKNYLLKAISSQCKIFTKKYIMKLMIL